MLNLWYAPRLWRQQTHYIYSVHIPHLAMRMPIQVHHQTLLANGVPILLHTPAYLTHLTQDL